ncbi:MAPK/MAK/MRK overlapping kinase isoform X1 [Selaginella moellendorffii]|uniref:MAPK/MAK/MRK overlapping kinase isoform X1 n=1 Tax=Selaginella moellendorffii TaxID=88036 RepID=UPI000D1C5FD9|nr:MAPK/MAK/MRK overlapping kinase isoform X1 [Selaginella moellendorffii]|eukprot:XP_024542504.1 MAPK/MAK/MRK overlapping kinase isoform X1 [Selaginella moellendorffii]
MHKYRMICKKGEGTFSEVLKAQCHKSNKYVAIKCMKNTFDSLEQVTNLREIQALQRLSPHTNVIKLLEVLYDQPTGRLALVFELMDMNIYELIRGRRTYVSEDRIKSYMFQLLKAMDHMHRNGIFHRDIKPENILIMEESLKLADLGSCRGVYSKQPYTEYISTRCINCRYRAPECLLTDGYYNYKMDMWGVGCVFFEIISLFPLFPGTNELDQIQKIHKVMGTPPQQLLDKMRRRSQHADFKFPQQDGTGIARLIPHASPACVELLNKLLAYNPDDRISARQALRHPYFKELREKEKLQQAFANANRANSLRPSPSHRRLAMHDVSPQKSKDEDAKLQGLGTGNPSAASTPRSMASTQLPCLNVNSKAKELSQDGKDTGGSSPLSHAGDSRTPATLTSVSSAVSVNVGGATDAGSSCMDLDGGGGGGCSSSTHGLPPIKNSYTLSMLSPKPQLSSLHRHSHYHSPKAHSVKGVKIVKGTKSHRVLPELSPKSISGGYKPGEPPPYKKRANSKYTSPYSQKYINHLAATLV